jgi:hypothetical protein
MLPAGGNRARACPERLACCEVAHNHELPVRLQKALDETFEIKPEVATPLLPYAPNPAASLDNLGNRFSALGRPAETVTAHDDATKVGLQPER